MILAKEKQQSKYIYNFAEDFKVGASKLQCMRIYRHKTNTFNQFQHKIVIYPEAIVRNAIALNSDKGEYMKDCVVEIGQQQWKAGATK